MIDNFEICTDLEHCLNQLGKNQKMAVGLSRSYALNERNPLNPRFYCFDKFEFIYEYDLKILMRKNFSHQKRLNRFIEMASESGLIEKWSKRIVRQYSTPKDEDMYKHIKSNNFYGIYLLVTAVNISIIVIFFFERYVHKMAHAPNSSRFWVYLDLYISPDRFFWLENRWD